MVTSECRTGSAYIAFGFRRNRAIYRCKLSPLRLVKHLGCTDAIVLITDTVFFGPRIQSRGRLLAIRALETQCLAILMSGRRHATYAHGLDMLT